MKDAKKHASGKAQPSQLGRLLAMIGTNWNEFGRVAGLHRSQKKRIESGTDKGNSLPLYSRCGAVLGLTSDSFKELRADHLAAEDLAERAEAAFSNARAAFEAKKRMERRVQAAADRYEQRVGDPIAPGVVQLATHILMRRNKSSESDIERVVARVQQDASARIAEAQGGEDAPTARASVTVPRSARR